MSDTTTGVAAGRRRYAREHGDVTTREFAADEVAGSGIERGKAMFASKTGNRSARDAVAAADDHDADAFRDGAA
jgi:hypothetical protein